MGEKLKYLHMKAQFIVSSNSSYGERGKKKNRVTQVAIVLDRVSSPRVKGNKSYLHFKTLIFPPQPNVCV